MKPNMQTVFAGLQALSATVVMLLALWAAFFTSLPETLFVQLRSELTEANIELESRQRQIFRLEDDRSQLSADIQRLTAERDGLALEVTNRSTDLIELDARALELEQANSELRETASELLAEISSLEQQRGALEDQIELLAAERGQYALIGTELVVSRYVALMCYELLDNRYFANIARQYPVHRRWLDLNREVTRLRSEYDSIPIRERFSGENEFAVRFRQLEEEARESPDIWLGRPREPVLSPGVDDEQITLDFPTITILNSFVGDGSFEETHDDLINFFFDNTLRSRGVEQETFQDLSFRLLQSQEVEGLLSAEQEELETAITEMLLRDALVGELVIVLTYESEPEAAQVPTGSDSVIENIDRAVAALNEFASDFLPNSTVECESQ